MTTSPVQHDRAYGLVPFALYFVVIELYTVDVLRGMRPGHFVASFFESLRQGVGFSWFYFSAALLELNFWLVIGVGLVLVIVALMRKRMFRSVFIVWLLLIPLYVVQFLANAGLPGDPMVAGLLLAAAIIACAGIFYALRSKGVAVLFNR